MTDLTAFGLAVLAVLVTPGPTNTLLASSGALVGIVRSLPLLLAELAGYTAGILTAHAVLDPLMSSFAGARTALGCAVGIYLVVVAVRVWRTGLGMVDVISGRDVLVTTLLNPKGLVFALFIIPWQTPATAWYFGLFASILVPVGLSWIALGALARHIIPTRKLPLVPRSAAVVIAALGVAVIGLALRA